MPDLASNLEFAGNRQHERGKGWIDSGVGEERSESICEHKSFAVMAQAAAVARAQSGRLVQPEIGWQGSGRLAID